MNVALHGAGDDGSNRWLSYSHPRTSPPDHIRCGLAFGFCSSEVGLGPFNQQVPLELSDGVEDIHGHRSGRTCQIDAAKREAMNCTPIPASFLTVVLTSMASRPRRLSLVTINTSPNSA